MKKNIIDRVRTFEGACKIEGVKPADVIPFKGKKLTPDQVALNALAMLMLIVKVLREGVVLDYADSNQPKWYPWFIYDKSLSGFRFGGPGYVYTNTLTSGGSRLCVDTEAKAKYMGTKFIKLYNLVLKS
jgi:hypothetical protein